jgi:ribosome biogenesis ATPase
MDELSRSEKQIIVIGCTSRPETIDSALRRAGRFEREISIGVPNEEARIEIMKILTRKMRLREDFNFEEMVKLTPGYVGADIQTLCKEASITAVERIITGKVDFNVKKPEKKPVQEGEEELGVDAKSESDQDLLDVE